MYLTEPFNCYNYDNFHKILLVVTNIFYLILGIKYFNSFYGRITFLMFFVSTFYHLVQTTIDNCKELKLIMLFDMLISILAIIHFFIFKFRYIKGKKFLLILFSLSLLCFSYNLFTNKHYHIFHSMWHILSSSFLYFVLRQIN